MSNVLFLSELEYFVACFVVFILSITVFAIPYLRCGDNDNEAEESRDIESQTAQTRTTRTERVVVAGARAGIIPRHFIPNSLIAGFALRALPPVTIFQKDETSPSQNLCSICIEHFSDGNLVQPFGVCVHRFHPFCIHSWLLQGKINCPLCRKQLSINLHH
ncbi:hypothetical protein DEO72_LG1g680 [Vigna unguiculata]|uniref:RING-type domain-containing protein n=1 Tax=Vigna unguiculata TaxID=3917 RepID=A0A4D6KI71_VIGUN|nr:hypothetical protein DEO72_LG1g680 [Vigna unguiculata]